MSGFGLVEKYEAVQINDPCPLTQYNKEERTLRKWEKIIHAPQSQVSAYLFDKDGDYITLPKKHVVFTEQLEENEDIKHNEGV